MVDKEEKEAAASDSEGDGEDEDCSEGETIATAPNSTETIARNLSIQTEATTAAKKTDGKLVKVKAKRKKKKYVSKRYSFSKFLLRPVCFLPPCCCLAPRWMILDNRPRVNSVPFVYSIIIKCFSFKMAGCKFIQLQVRMW